MSSELSLHDKAVLNCIFNPTLPLSEAYDESLEELKDIEDECDYLQEVNEMEITAINKAEHQEYDEALKIIKSALELMPNKASLYNNRAQILQFKGNFEAIEAFVDLTEAINLAGEKQKKTLCHALCQRGLLHRKYNRTELARSDFSKAAELGSKFAKSQLVELNPYAALCNQMLRKVMDELK